MQELNRYVLFTGTNKMKQNSFTCAKFKCTCNLILFLRYEPNVTISRAF